ncbi:MAG TPA: hypothetical protein VMM93_11530 [Vicinamibacterales bacterium]|nr:hypothetical protein [Vicinamibacterales bacterium]
MSPVWHAAMALAVLVTWLTTPPNGLADIARREALRRALAGPSGATFSDDQLPATPVAAAVSGIPALTPPPASPPATASGAEGGADEPRDEAWWRGRMTAAQNSLERNQVLAEAMQSRINALQTDVVNLDDPAQQAQSRLSLGRALGELERLQKAIEAGRQEIARIQDEARRQRVPPGWIR